VGQRHRLPLGHEYMRCSCKARSSGGAAMGQRQRLPLGHGYMRCSCKARSHLVTPHQKDGRRAAPSLMWTAALPGPRVGVQPAQ